MDEYRNLEEFRSLSPLTISSKRVTITSFMNYLGDSKNLSLFSGNELFPVIFTNKRERILSFYSIEEIGLIVTSIDRDTPYGKRDFVVVLLAAELGIRSGDITRLKMSDIRWERDTIEFIQLPLLENIKYALIDYLKNERPNSDSEHILLGIKNQGKPLTNTSAYTRQSPNTSERQASIQRNVSMAHMPCGILLQATCSITIPRCM